MQGYITAARLSCFLAFLMIASSCSHEFSSRRYGRSMYVKALKETVKPLKTNRPITKRPIEQIKKSTSRQAQLRSHEADFKPVEKQALGSNQIMKKNGTMPIEEVLVTGPSVRTNTSYYSTAAYNDKNSTAIIKQSISLALILVAVVLIIVGAVFYFFINIYLGIILALIGLIFFLISLLI